MTDENVIREVLNKYIKQNCSADSFIANEMGICSGRVIADVVCIDDKLHGYEIKSDKDTLVRLGNQIEFYNKVFDTNTIVVGETYLQEVLKIIPEWWGMMVVSEGVIQVIKHPKENPSIDPNSLIELVWRDEAFEFLKERNMHKGLSNKGRRILWDKIVENTPFVELHQFVVLTLKNRKKWKNKSE